MKRRAFAMKPLATKALVLGAWVCGALGACDWSLERMMDQSRCDTDEPSPYFENGSCNQAPPEGTVRFLSVKAPPASTAQPLQTQVAVPTRALISHGRNRFETFCAPCHGVLANGYSQVAENMVLRPPPSLLEPRITNMSDAYLTQVIAVGFGLMPAYAWALSPEEQQAVVMYLRVLERSQNAVLDNLPAHVREEAQLWLR